MPVHVVIVVSPFLSLCLCLCLSLGSSRCIACCCCDCRRLTMKSCKQAARIRLRTRKSSLRSSTACRAAGHRHCQWRAANSPRVARGDRRTRVESSRVVPARSLRSLHGPQRLDSYTPRCIPPLAMWPSISRGRWALLPRSLPTSNNLQTQTLPPMPP